jgi:hypothetical protein
LEPTRAFLKGNSAPWRSASKADAWIKGSEAEWKIAKERLSAKVGTSTYPAAGMACFGGEGQPEVHRRGRRTSLRPPHNDGVGCRIDGPRPRSSGRFSACTTFDAQKGQPTFERVNDEIFAHVVGALLLT